MHHRNASYKQIDIKFTPSVSTPFSEPDIAMNVDLKMFLKVMLFLIYKIIKAI